MKANKKFVEGDEAVSAVIGVILMVAITVAIAATVYVYVSGMLGSGPAANPTVSMVQSTGFISITQIDNGPVIGADVTVNFINQSDASNMIDATLDLDFSQGTSAVNVDGGDLITEPATVGPAGTVYTVQMVYGGNVIGTCIYSV